MTEITTGRKSRTAVNINSNPSFPAYVPPPAGSEGGSDNEYDLTTLPETEQTDLNGYGGDATSQTGPQEENQQNSVAPADNSDIINTSSGEEEKVDKPGKPAKPRNKTAKPAAAKTKALKGEADKGKSPETKKKETEMPVAVKTPPAKIKAKGQTPQQPKKTISNGTAGNTTTIRQRVFELLGKNPEGLTGRAIAEKLSLKGIPNLLKDEGVCEKPRIKRVVVEGVRGVTYVLTAAGKNDLAKGKVDENAAPSSSGVEW